MRRLVEVHHAAEIPAVVSPEGDTSLSASCHQDLRPIPRGGIDRHPSARVSHGRGPLESCRNFVGGFAIVSLRRIVYIVYMGKHSKPRIICRNCPICGAAFQTGSSIKIHCSPECRVKATAADFAKEVGCWTWPGSINPQTGYGQLSHWEDGKRVLLTAHRVSFLAFVGAIPSGQGVFHRCDNRPCFNPAHLFCGSQTANMHDMLQKGRGNFTERSRGAAHYAAKLSEKDVAAIRNSRATLAEIAQAYGMSVSAVHAVKSRRTWKHVT